MSTVKSLIGVLVILIVVIVLQAVWMGSAKKPEIFSQEITFDAALKQSADDGSIVVVDAAASWCPPCKKMDRSSWIDAEVVSWIAANGIAIQIDVDEMPEIAAKLRVEAMPTVIVFRDGVEIDRAVGYQSGTALLAWLRSQ